ncbi:MAG: hypothetical protein QOJ64_1716 [Acidobacteriota bacterium]|jgi:hypothetical protein|nr:hypothetical protein [Acidobacteriota bacterium]
MFEAENESDLEISTGKSGDRKAGFEVLRRCTDRAGACRWLSPIDRRQAFQIQLLAARQLEYR